jgi:hypothetical protein
MIKTLIFKYFAGNLDKLIGFLQDLDKHLDAYIAAQDKKISDVGKQISELETEEQKLVRTRATASNLQSGVKGLTTNGG